MRSYISRSSLGDKCRKEYVVIAHNIRSLHNIGSIFRTADGAGVCRVYLTGYSGSPNDPKAAKVALGAERSVPWERTADVGRCITRLKKEGYRIVALEQSKKSISYNQYRLKFPIALLIGNEVRGISSALLKKVDAIIDIPMRGTKESLNVSVAFGIAVYELLKVHQVRKVKTF